MPISVNEFWKLVLASGLLPRERCLELHRAFTAAQAADQPASVSGLAQWLVAGGVLSRYQASVLASGRPGPFVFGEYTIVERIESGRLRRLFRARHQGKRPVLLAFTAQLPEGTEQPELIAERASAAQAIDSPHVMRVERFVDEPPHAFTVSEDLAGKSLRECLTVKKFSLEQTCRIGFQAALGLVALHAAKRPHGMPIPEHIWIDSSQTVKLLQFPLVSPPSPADRQQSPLIDYLAPELGNPRARSSDLTDIYALGCTLYELIAGQVPFPGDDPAGKLQRHRSQIPPRLDQLVPGVPEEMADLVAEMLDKEPLLRTRTAGQVAHLLAPFVSKIAPNDRRPGPPKLDDNALTPGYGAWSAPAWQAPPKQMQPKQAPQPSSEKPTAVPAAPIQTAPAVPASRAEGGLREIDFAAPTKSAAAEPWEPPLESRRPGGTVGGGSGSRGSSNKLVIGLALATLAVAAIAAVALLVGTPGEPAPSAPPATTTNAPADAIPSNTTPQADANAAVPAVAIPPAAAAQSAKNTTDDDGQTLWISPTAGNPLAIDYLPSSAQLIIAWRPTELLAHSEGAKILDALGPGGAAAREELLSVLGIALADIEQLTIAVAPDELGEPQTAYVVRLRVATQAAELLKAWGQPALVESKTKKFYRGAKYAYYLPDGADDRVAVVARVELLREIVERDGPPLVRKGIERLLANSDDRRQFSVLFAPSYLLTDGRNLLSGDLEKLRDPLTAFIPESVQAMLVSAHLDDALFLELRATGSVDLPPQELLRLLQTRLAKVPEQVESYVAALELRPYGRLVVNRLPRMVQLLADYTRGGVERQQAVLRCYLPAVAAHNLLLGTELALWEEPSGHPGVAANGSAPSSNGAAEALAKRISLSFPRDTLEHCLEMLSKEIDVEVVILGADLQLEGITKNQSFALDQRDRPAGEVLQAVLKLANPAGKLVYVIRPREGGASGKREALFITTRTAATKRGERLSGEFEAKTEKDGK